MHVFRPSNPEILRIYPDQRIRNAPKYLCPRMLITAWALVGKVRNNPNRWSSPNKLGYIHTMETMHYLEKYLVN